MVQEPRKATDVLIEVESKIDSILDIVRSQDLNIKILSNKVNDLMGQLKAQQAGPPKITVEAVQTPPAPAMPPGFTQMPPGDPNRTVPIVADSKLPSTDTPQGFRRNSRPETFANSNKKPTMSGDDTYLVKPAEEVRMPIQVVNRQGQTPLPPVQVKEMAEFPDYDNKLSQKTGQIPTMQRIVDKNGKSVFLADVEILDLSTSEVTFKTRTNGTGKWMASLGVGAYRVTVSKRGNMNKEKLEAIQDIQVDGSQSPLELPMVIIK